MVELLAVVFVGLRISIVYTEEPATEGIVAIGLLHRAVCPNHHTVVAQMVLQVIVVHRCGPRKGDVTIIYQYHF
ncbi:MAG: hypothetical protein WAR39_09500 [Prevotella sp.]